MNKEQYWKMKQLDRIEYHLLRKDLDDSFSFQTFSFVIMMLQVVGFILVLALLMYAGGLKDGFIALFGVLPSIMLIFRVGLWIVIACDIFLLIVQMVLRRRLEKRFSK